MKIASLRLAGLAFLAATTAASAADMAVKARPAALPVWANDILAANNQIGVAFAYQNYDYVEYSPGQAFNPAFPPLGAPFNSEKGWIPGVSVTGSWMGNLGAITNVYLWGRGTYLNGNTDYWAPPAAPRTSGQDGAQIWDADFRVGKGFDLAPNAMLTPYIGAGWHYWNRNLTGGFPLAYREEYEHGYAGGGLMFQWAPVQRLVLEAHGLVGSTFNSSMKTSNTVGPVINPQTYTLGNSAIYMVGASADYAFTDRLHGNLGAEWTRFKYGQSAPSVIDGSVEPSSRTDTVTVRAGIGYSFYAGPVVAKY